MSREYYNLNEVLHWRAEHSSNQPAFTFLKEGCEEEAQWSYAELDRAARAIASRLQESISIGQRVLLLFPPSLEFVAAFWGCLYAGAIAVPAYPVRSQANVQRLKNIVKDCQPSAVLITRRGLLRMKDAMDSDLAALQWIETDSLSGELADAWQEPQISRDSIALLQYTSGSTGQPKGVVVSHGNLLHNEEIIRSTFGQSNRSVIVGWLPLYHDMGLMGTILQPVYSGARCILMSPNAFLQRPFRWLEAISRYRATTSGGPNFAYELCVRKITDEERSTLDLRNWTVAFNGAETVRAETLERFAARFAEVGFSRKSFRPCYGLAEATLLVSAQSSKQQAGHLTIDANKLSRNQVKVVSSGAGAIDVVSCGRTADGHEIAIVDPETFRRRGRNQVGEIWLAGPSVAKGYWNRPGETTRLFAARTTDTAEGPFLRTGDLGFIRNGSLFITGRSKDLIIIRGRNHYPQDIELTAQAAHPALKPGLGAAFSTQGEEGECLVVLHEVEHGKEQQLSGAIDSICQAIAEQHEIQVHAVLLLRSGTIPRTSSGKIQRYLCRDMFLQEKLSCIVEWRVGARGPIASSTQAVLKSSEGIQGWLAEKFAAWAGVARENIQVHEPISRYGLDSLASIELSHAAERELELSLPLSSLMQGKSIVELTRELMNGQPTFEELQAEPQAGSVIEEVTLSEGQKSLWYLHQLAPESTAYNLAFVARIVNGADTGVLRQIFQTLVERHSSLRTTFHADNAGDPFQRVHPLQNASVVEVDASGWSDSVLEQHFQEGAATHFNLELGPLFRVTLFRCSDSECFIAITLHHIIGDLWSLAMLLHEMGILYAAETKGEELMLPPPESSYSRFVLWQRAMLSSAEGARLQDYWSRQLDGELPVLELSTDRVRPTIQTYHGAAKTFDLGAELTVGLRNISHEKNATLNVILLAAFQVLLHRHSGQCDLLVGSPAANRTRASWANVFGYFVNPVVLRSQLHRNLPFDEFLAETHTTVVEALEHQHYPFSTLVEKLQPDRDPSRSPLFQAMFLFEKTRFLEQEGISAFALGGKGTRLEFDGLTFESVSPESTKALFDLTLRVAEAGEETRCSFEYNTDLFDEETIRRMAEQWRQLLHGIVAAETTPVRNLPLLNDAERKQMLEGWNGTEREYGGGWVQELFEEQVKRRPEAIAVEYEEERLNYEELNRRCNQLGHYLRRLGVGPEVRVGLCMERSLEMVVAIMGVLKAGGAYVPLDPSYPAERLSYMLEDTQAAVLLTQAGLQEKLQSYRGQIIHVDGEWERISSYSAANPECEVSGENLAYVIYTSGSTGQPKGVGIRHASAMVLMQWGREVFSEEELSGVLAGTSVCFDLSVFEILVPLSWGGKVILAGNALELLRMGDRQQVKLVNTVPSVMRELVRRQGVPESVVTVNLAGEALQAELVRQVYGMEGVRRVLNLYGPSEDTTYSTYAWIGQEEAEAEGKAGVSIGRPVANRAVYVLDEEMELVPVGVAGELYIGGAGLARGYVNQAGVTAERFVPNPFARRGGERLYQTGDRARWRSDGNLEYLGRLDQQVKVRGYRIELGEIEATLQKQEGVREAVVVAREDEPGEKRLVAYVVGEEKEGEGSGQMELDGSELRRQLRERLPEYMVPSAYVQMEEMPLNANGKVDRKRLPAPEGVATGGQEQKVRMVEEEILCGIWEQVLKVERVGVEENFFEIGGHSLLATQVVSRIRGAFGVELPLRILFERPTVAGLAEAVKQARGEEGGRKVAGLVRVEKGGELPLSYAQQRLWFLEQMEPGNAVYNVPLALRIRGELDREALVESMRGIVERHEVLRTVFVWNGEQELVQRVLSVEEAGVVVEVKELGEMGGEQGEAEARREAGVEAGKGFNLKTGPLLRVKLLGMGEQDHVLLVTMHHIVSDGWSIGILVREFMALYEGYVTGREPELEELAIQYGDYAAWQREWLGGGELQEQMKYWKEQLGGVEGMELGTDHVRPAVMSHGGATVEVEWGEELTRRVRGLCRREGVTLFMALLGGLQVLLGRYAGKEEVVVGTPIANRTREEIEPLIGFFVNTLVLRGEVRREWSIREMLKRVREVTLAAYGHQDVPFEQLVEELQPERDLSRNPLFDVMLIVQNAPQERISLAGLSVEGLGTEGEVAKFDLTFSAEESGGKIRVGINYARELYERGTIERMMGHFRAVMEEMSRNAEGRIGEVRMLSEEERAQLEGWNGTEREYGGGWVQELFEEQVKRRPEAIAVEYEEERLNYEELNRRCNQLGHYLRRLGVGPEVRVGLCMERSLEMVVAIMGVLKAGGAYVPLDPSYPAERLSYMLEDTQAAVLLTQAGLQEKLQSYRGQIIHVDGEWERISSYSAANPECEVSGENLAYVIYTSGSTGQPKGVGIRHASAMVLMQWGREVFSEEELSGVLAGTSVCFDLSVFEILVPLSWGGKVILAGNALELLRMGDRQQVKLVNTVPSVMRELVRRQGVPESVVTVNLAGEALQAELVRQVYGMEGVRRVLNLYGPSEDTTYSTYAWIGQEEAEAEGKAGVSIGRPVANRAVYVLDEEMELVPVGVAGELYIGGAGLARGYVNQAGVTAERFVPNPFARRGGERLYQTGDRARWRSDGNLEYLGRLDQQVKVRGYRIELGEIEATLQKQEGVREAVVVAREDEPGEKRLVAYVVGEEKEGEGSGQMELDGSELRRQLRERLPEYMVPSAYVQMEEMPLNANGKVDRKRLPAPEGVATGGQEQKVRMVEEEILCGIWEQVLKVERVGVEENFFEIGGHSLLATQVVSRIRGAFGVELPLRILFERPTVAGLAEAVKQARGEEGGRKVAGLVRVEKGGELPLSYAQQRLWFLEQMEPGNAVYNVPLALRIRGELDREALVESMRGIVERHEVLRTVFVWNGEQELVQRVLSVEEAGVVVEVKELGEMGGEQGEAEARREAGVEAGKGFNLKTGPLLRVKLLGMGEQDHVLLVTMHHIVSDGWSIGILVREFMALYEGYVTGREPELEELAIQYGDYAAWQREWLGGGELQEQMKYWKEQLGGVEGMELGTDHVRPAVMSHGGATVEVEWGEELTRGVRGLCRREGVTLFMALLGGLQVLLGRYAGKEEVVVGTPIANRTREEIEPLIGFFVNTLVLRGEVRREWSIREMLKRVREVTLAAYGHQDVPFEQLVEELQPERDLSRNPLFDVMLIVQNAPQERISLAGLSVEGLGTEGEVAKFDLTFSAEESGGKIRVGINYARELYERGTIERMMGHFRAVMEEMSRNAEGRIGEVRMLSEEERAQLEGWNGTEREYGGGWVQELFEEQVKRRPEAIAVEYEEERLNYEELNRRCNQLGHYLRRLGVGPEVRVGLCMERSLEMVVAIMGVLKAGGAYVPLDPSYPAERLSYMLEDTQAAVLLTQAGLQEKLQSYRGQIIHVDGEWERISSYSAANPECEVSGENLAYVIYTSGSTGQPKGVGIRHASAMVLMQWGREVFSEEELSGVLAGTSVCFDLSVFEILVPLSWGGKVILAGNALELLRMGDRQQVKLVNTVPSVMRELVRRQGVPESVVTVNLAGEALQAELVRQVYGMEGVRRVLNLYGPSEDTTYSTYAWIGQEEAEAEGKAGVSIGRPVANRAVYVLDEEMELVPVGVAGELYIGGAGLARGYVNQAGVTAERFVPNPFARRGGERLYQTGDRARWRSDGNLEYLGRLDQQVKVRGYRIELGEIEATLQKQEGVREAVVVAREDEPGEKRLVAYVVGEEKEGEGSGQMELDGSELRRQLRERLPEYMVPSAYVQMEEMPLNANGKVDRKRLPAPEGNAYAVRGYQAPVGEVEQKLASVWAEVLKVERVGRQDNFFVLGGHSLLATQVITRTQTAFGVELPLRAVFETNTLAGFAAEVERALKKKEKAEIPAIAPLPREGTFPLSFAQQRLWFLQQMQPASAAYNCPVMLRLSGELDQEVLARSLQGMVMRHEMLRTTFPSHDDRPVQKINLDMAPQIHVTDLEGLLDEQKEKTAEQFAAEEANKPFDLADGPLFRVQLLRLNPQEHVLLVTMHHIITDAWSNEILTREFVELYSAQCQGRAPQLEEQSLQYADFAVWQRNWLEGEICEKQMDYWRKQLEEATTLEIPTDYPRPINPTNAGAVLHFNISADRFVRLNELARRQGVTLFMTLLAAFKVLLGRLTGQTDVVTGTVIANRRNKDTEPLMGFFVNQLVLRADLNGDPSFRVFLESIRKTLLDAYDNQDVPFEKLAEELMPERMSTRSPFFDVVFAMQNIQGKKIELPGLELRPFAAAELPTKWDLTLIVQEREAGLAGSFYYATELFAEITARRFMERYDVLLESIVQDIERSVSELNLLSHAERHQLLVEWNNSRRVFPDLTAADLFRIQVETEPLASAVVFGQKALTYQELDRLTNQLGRYLRNLGVQAETRVGLYLERGIELITGALGVLKAGGAYVPLDPAYPAERLAFMAEDAQLSVILTQNSLYSTFPNQWILKVCLDQDWSQIASEDSGALDSVTSPLNAAYVIYTSGSTGQPKGVCLTHQGLCNLALAQREIFHLSPESSVLQFSSFSFDAATWEMSMALLSGARFVLGSKEQILPGTGLLDLLKANSVTVATIPPSVLAALPEEQLPALETLVVAGEACSSELVKLWASGRCMLNAYGPTETTVCATISQPLNLTQLTPPIGRPIANMQVYVLDEHFALAPIGAGGELCIAGTGLARGYLNRPELTAEKFVPNPYGDAGERLYRTGDRARWRFDGQLEFLGRLDDQIKLRGFRIELGEIEAVLRQVAGVRQVVVLAADEDTGDKRLVAYVVPDRWTPKSLVNGYLLANGRRISQENANETDLLFREIFERSAYAKHGISLHEESCVLDVGANIGIFMLWASEQAPRGRVYCFEPIADVFEHLRRNSTLCDCAVKLFPIGLAEADMTTEFIYYPRCTAMSGLGKYADPQADLELVKMFIASQQQDSPEAGDFLREATGVLAPRFEGEKCEVRVRRLSDVLREEKIEHVDLLKIDVERAELDVLYGIDAEDWEKIDQIVIEAHDEAGRASEGRVEIIRGLLDRAGYEVVIEEEANLRGIGLWNVFASRRGRSELRSAGDEQSQRGRVQAKELDVAALKHHAQERLPGYMVPGLYVELDEIPLTTNGKVDRKALLELRTRAIGNTDGQTQRGLYSPVQEIVAGIWCEVLELNHVDCEANFFEIGGHSLLATQVISRIREAFGVALELHALFDNPQLGRLAEAIEEARQETASVSMPLIQRTDKSKDPPLSFAQQRLWFIDQMDPGNPAYNATFGVRLSGELNYNAVRQSLTGIVQRHEILRTSFQIIGSEPRQIIGQVEDMAPRFIDLSGTDPEKWEAETRQLAHHEYNTRFDLSQGPLMRTVLVKFDKHEHLLLATMHHIVSDGWSLAIVVREFSRLYEGHLQGKSVQLEELAIQYDDFAVWQREWLQGEVLKEQLEYWKTHLAGAPVLALPTDKPRPAVASHRGQSVTFELTQDLTERLLALARRESVTPFMLLLAAYQVLLCRYTEQEDIVVGSPIANRNRAEIEPLIGFFINQIALRSKIRRDGSFSELLATVRAVSLDAYAHQDLPFEKLVEELSPERTLSHAPVFQVVFALQNAPYEEIHLPGLKLAAFAPEREFEKTDLSLVMEERKGVLNGELSYATDLFEKSTIEHFIGHFCCVLEDVAQDPSKSIQDLILMTGAEREQLLESWNPLRVAHPAPSQCLHELFEAQAKRIPQTTAVMYEGEALTYADLNQKANQLARYLHSLGVERELRVGIFLERSLETIVAVLGTLKAGAAYVPLDPGLPAERLAQMIEDVQVAVLITREKLRDKLPSVWAQVVSIDQDWETIAQEEASNPAVNVSSDCLAYVIFTSGSTGKPKGVGIEHRQICRYTNAVTDCLQMQEGWSYGLISTFAADLGNTMLFPSLCIGGTLHVIAEDNSRDGNAMTQYVQEHGVLDCLKITPTQLRVLVENGGSSIMPAKRLVIGGEASTWEWAREWQTIRPKCHIWNHYGPTESTVGVCTFDISGAMAESAPEHGNVLLGKPLQHSRLYVLDEAGELVPVGVPGELYIGGEGVGRGYLNSSSATAEKFVPDPFSGIGARLYRTGDRVRWIASGNLEFLGRKDKQVKLRGYRIELGEIENLLNEHADVRYATVMVREDDPGQQQLVAYFVPRWRDDHSTQDASRYRLPNDLRVAQQNKNETEYLHHEMPQLAPTLATIAANNHESVAASSELKAYLAKKLPEYMVPTDFVRMDELPLLANGKLDYKALPRPKERESLENYKKPRTPMEEILAEIWSDVLKVDHVGIEDNFFVLGGHSLLATQVISRAQVALETELPLRMLFEEPTIARFAACVESTNKQSSLPISPIPRVSRDLPLPLSFGQQRLWFLQQLDPDSNLYNLPYVLHLTGSLDQSSLRSAFSEIVRRHEILRTRYEMVGDETVQRIDPAGAASIEYIDLRHVAEPEAEALALAKKYAREAFDLGRGPLMRIRLLQLAERDYVLSLVLHHIVSDGWSIGILVREFMALYEGYVTGREPELEELAIQYGDYAAWQREWLGGGELQEQMKYWKEQLGGVEGMELGTDHVRPAVMSHGGATVEVEWGEELTRRVRGLCRREGVTLFMALLGGLQVLLGRYAGKEEVVVGTPIANRTREEIEPLIGFFVNTLVLRGEVRREWSIREMLKRVREVTLAAYGHQDVPFEQLVEELQPERDLSRNPLFDVMLIVQNAPQERISLAGLSVEGLGTEGEVAKFDLTFSAEESGGKIRVGINYARELYERGTIERMMGHFRAVMEEMSRNAEGRIGEVRMLSEEERAQLEGWNGTEREYGGGWVQELFEEQVKRRPEAIAVEYEEERLNYEELNRRCNQLGHYLRRLGVGPEVRVGLCMERSLEMVVAIMGVLKAGGAYVPLDPSYPAERLSYMLEDTQAAVLLTQAGLQEKLQSYRGQIIHVDGEWERISSYSAANPECEVSGENLAYVIYTSGSTGQPKGVGIRHRGLTNYLQWANGSYRIGETNQDSVSPVHSPLGFDLTVTSIFPALLAGHCISLLTPGEEINALAEGLQKDSAYSLLKLTPSHLKILSACLGGSESVRGVKMLIVGGENLNYQDLSLWLKQLGEIRLMNEYGPTETVVGCCVYEVSDAEAANGAVPIGRPIANTQIHVLDSELQPVPVGVAGELYIGGAGLARGYVNQAGATAERFVPNPFARRGGGERLYQTGDRARWRSDGNLEYLGRLDQQVKIRGYRIELGEIEATLQKQEGVREAVVVAREDEPGEKRLVAYYTCGEQETAGAEELRRQLRERLPEYMVPSAYVQMEEMPLNANGKVDRKRLPQPERGGEEAGYQEPQGDVEQTLADIWKQVLRLERVGREDNFFELGGDSILSIRVVARAMDAGMEITAQQMFQQQRLRELAGVADTKRKRRGEEEEVRGELELTAIQRWFFEQELEARHHFNQALLLSVRSDVDGRRLGEAVEAVLKHHDAARLQYWQEEERWKQRYGEDRELEGIYTRIDLRGVEKEKRKERMKEICGELQRSLDLESGPLVRVAYFELGDGEMGRLFWVMHHLIVDGVSWRVLLEDVHTAWGQMGKGGKVKLPEKTASLQKWVAGLKEWVGSGELEEEERGYWLSLKARVNGKLPRDYEGGRGTVADNDQVVRELGEKETAVLLREAPRRYKMQIQEALLTALVDAVGEWTGEEGVLVDMEGHGREAVPGGVNVTRTVGWFTSLYPVWLPVRRGMDVERRMEGVRRTMMQVPRHGIGYGLLRYFGKQELRKELGEAPQAEISFNYLGQLDGALPEESLFTAAAEQQGQDERQKRSHALGLLASISNGKLRIVLNYSREAQRRETVENLVASLMVTLNEVASVCQNNNGYSENSASPEMQLSDAEMRKLLSTVSVYRPTVRK